MFEWLEKEILEVKTPRFHLVEGPANEPLREAISATRTPLPQGYKEFVLSFGNSRLYRNSRNGYRVGVYGAPREARSDGALVCHLGFHDGACVYAKPTLRSAMMPIFEFEDDEEVRVAEGFEEWLMLTCAGARAAYGKKKWAEILRGPEPFTLEEERIVEARGLIRWRDLGIDASGNHILEITNNGTRTLSALTVGVKSANGRLNGAIRLDIGQAVPGQSAVVRADCYKDLVSPKEVELFSLPDPKPEDRDYYWELGKARPIPRRGRE